MLFSAELSDANMNLVQGSRSIRGTAKMVSAIASNHNFVILKSWTKSAEHNRGQLLALLRHNPHGRYSVRMSGSNAWTVCECPPNSGVAEWLFVNSQGVPLFYWNLEKNSVMLIS